MSEGQNKVSGGSGRDPRFLLASGVLAVSILGTMAWAVVVILSSKDPEIPERILDGTG